MFKRLRLVVAVLLIVGVGWYVIQYGRHSSPRTPAVTKFQARVPLGTTQVLVAARQAATRSVAEVTLWESRDATWVVAKGPYTARIGENGFRLAETRTEGDRTTPEGVFPLPAAFGAERAPQGTTIPYSILQPGDCWVSTPTEPAYNRWVTRTPCGKDNLDLYARGHEDNSLLHTALIIGFNTSPRLDGAGSAIFFHLPRRDANGKVIPTTGGIGLGEGSLRAIIARLDQRRNPVAILGDPEWIEGG